MKKKRKLKPFNYDLKQMQKAVDSPTVMMPRNLTDQKHILKWLLEQ